MFFLLALWVLFIPSVYAESLDGTSNVIYKETHHVFRNNDTVTGFVNLKNGFTILPGAALFMETACPISGAIDLRGTGTLVLKKSLILDGVISLSDSGKIYGNGTSLILHNDVTIPQNKVLHCQGQLTINGNGNTLYFDKASQLMLDNLSSLTLKNMHIIIEQSFDGQPSLNISSPLSSLTLDNVILDLGSNLSINQGHLFVKNDVVVTGTNALLYNTPSSSYILSGSKLYFDIATTFSYTPAANAQDLMRFKDSSSRLFLNGCSLKTSSTGMLLDKGNLICSNGVEVDSFAENLKNDITTEQTVNIGATVNFVRWSPDGRYLAVGSELSGYELMIIRYWHDSYALVDYVSYGAGVKVLNWSPDGKFLAVGSALSGAQVKIYGFNGASLSYITSIDASSDVTHVAWSPDGRYLAFTRLSNNLGQIYFFDGTTCTYWCYFHIGTLTPSSYCVAWAPSGLYLCSAGTKGGSHFRCFRFSSSESQLIGSVSYGADGYFLDHVSWSPDGKYILMGGNWGIAIFLVFSDGSLGSQVSSTDHSGNLYDAMWSPSGTLVALGLSDGLEIWRFSPGSGIVIKDITTSAVNTVAFSPDGQRLVWSEGTNINVSRLMCNASLPVENYRNNAITFGSAAHGLDVTILSGARLNVRGNIVLNNA